MGALVCGCQSGLWDGLMLRFEDVNRVHIEQDCSCFDSLLDSILHQSGVEARKPLIQSRTKQLHANTQRR